MDCKNVSVTQPITTSQEMEQMQIEFDQKRPVTAMRHNSNTTSLIVPKAGGLGQRRIVFTDTENEIKALLYSMIVAAYNHVFTDKFASKSAPERFSSVAPPFVEWLNNVEIENKYELLKNYEAYRFDYLGNHGGNSALNYLKALFAYAFQDESYIAQLSPNNLQFLNTLRDTKVSPNLNKKQISLASYFGALPWLRERNIGVGADMYNIFASPKLTVNSLKSLAATVILELYDAKCALQTFLKNNHEIAETIQSKMEEARANDANAKSRSYRTAEAMHVLISTYHEIKRPSPSLQKAIALLLCSIAKPLGVDKVQNAIKSKEAFKKELCREDGGNSTAKAEAIYTSSLDAPMLSMEILRLLSLQDELPITRVEKLMFSWLMATLTVQPSDIAKLRKEHFRLFKVGGRVTDIECEYFKGRANAVHTTRSLSVKKADGKAVLIYLEQNSGEQVVAFDTSTPAIAMGSNSVIGTLVNAINLPFMNDAIAATHQKFGDIPMIIPKAIASLVRHGMNIYKIKGSLSTEKKQKIIRESGRACPQSIFGLKAIKNSAVHAFSDPYTLHYLINRNSHTNKTEKENYLNEDNEAWINASGRITRTVMLDLINNVFDLDFCSVTEKEKKAFNNEFESVTNVISYKTEEMLSRMKVVTEQDKGKINEVGVLSRPKVSTEQFSPIYVLDSPATVCKMYNYLHEFEANYKRLLGQNPHHLYQTAMPTAEWMEQVLMSDKLSRESKSEGKALFEKMRLSGVSMKVFHSL